MPYIGMAFAYYYGMDNDTNLITTEYNARLEANNLKTKALIDKLFDAYNKDLDTLEANLIKLGAI